jgi:hypothetical protein
MGKDAAIALQSRDGLIISLGAGKKWKNEVGFWGTGAKLSIAGLSRVPPQSEPLSFTVRQSAYM